MNAKFRINRVLHFLWRRDRGSNVKRFNVYFILIHRVQSRRISSLLELIEKRFCREIKYSLNTFFYHTIYSLSIQNNPHYFCMAFYFLLMINLSIITCPSHVWIEHGKHAILIEVNNITQIINVLNNDVL